MKKVYILQKEIANPSITVPIGSLFTQDGEMYYCQAFSISYPRVIVEENEKWFKLSYVQPDYDFAKWYIEQNVISKDDIVHLEWIYDRLRNKYFVDEHIDFMRKFKFMILKLKNNYTW